MRIYTRVPWTTLRQNLSELATRLDPCFGHVFSGTVATRTEGEVPGPTAGQDARKTSMPRALMMMGRATEQITDVPCGNTVVLVGMDQFLLKSGTPTTVEDAHNNAVMKYSVSPVVKITVRPKDGKDLPKLFEGLKKLSKSDRLHDRGKW